MRTMCRKEFLKVPSADSRRSENRSPVEKKSTLGSRFIISSEGITDQAINLSMEEKNGRFQRHSERNRSSWENALAFIMELDLKLGLARKTIIVKCLDIE
jgi:hypothetical protein